MLDWFRPFWQRGLENPPLKARYFLGLPNREQRRTLFKAALDQSREFMPNGRYRNMFWIRDAERPVHLSLLCAAGLARHHAGRIEA